MIIRDVLLRDPISPLLNQGQARLSGHNGINLDELREELFTFVCEGQYADGIQNILTSYLKNLGKPQCGAWVSGFFGSGKSHFLKMLCHLWQDTRFPNGETARNLVRVPDEIRELLRELDTIGRRSGGMVAAAGALPNGNTNAVRKTILSVVLSAVGLPESYSQARFCLWLHSDHMYDTVKSSVEADGKIFNNEINHLYVSGSIARAVMASDPSFATNESDAKQLFKTQFPPSHDIDITTDDFLRTMKAALRIASKDDRLPCTLIILDEVQQYIDDSSERSALMSEAAEAISKQLDGRAMIIGAGQSALNTIPNLQRLMDRFTLRVHLSDADVETVTRKVLLQKKPTERGSISALLERHAGEISRQLQGTRIGESIDDRAIIIEDYPLLPVRRRFWEECFRQIDAPGTNSQLRSQLRIIHDAVSKVADKPLGWVIPADELFNTLATDMINAGVLLREIYERIQHLSDPLEQRVCSLIFLIGKLKSEPGANTGVHAAKNHIADLLIEDITADNGIFRAKISDSLEQLLKRGVLMAVENDYRLQTREGNEWESELQIRQAKMNADAMMIETLREQLFNKEIEKVLRNVPLRQGEAKEGREFVVTRDELPPKHADTRVPIWIRDAWNSNQKGFVEAARAAGSESPILFAFIDRSGVGEDLKKRIIEAEALRQTLEAKGHPTTPEGQEARQSMESRLVRSESERDQQVREIVANMAVYQGGGHELPQPSLTERIRVAANNSLIRLFPRFKDADYAAWGSALKRARDADQPFAPIGYTGATEEHPVCREILSKIGLGKTGTQLRKMLGAPPYGWPQDAVDAALIALHRFHHVTAILNGTVVSTGQLDQTKIPKTEFRCETIVLSMSDRLRLRNLFQAIGIHCSSNEEGSHAGEFLTKMLDLAHCTGGEPPCPSAPSVIEIKDVQRLVGNEQLATIRDKADEWVSSIEAWRMTKKQIEQRLPKWRLLERLAKQAADIKEALPYLNEVNAVRENRLLLDSNDPTEVLRIAIASILRESVTKAQSAHEQSYAEAIASLNTNSTWLRIPSDDQSEIKRSLNLLPRVTFDISTDDALLQHLEEQSLSNARAEHAALSPRIHQAIERAARLLEPKIQSVLLESGTLHNEAEVEAWVERQKMKLMEAVRQGPILINWS